MTDTEHLNTAKQPLIERIVAILATGQTVEMPMLSGSMLPLLPPGAVITITRLHWRECRPGMIGVFIRDGSLTAHRLLLTWLPGPWGLCYQKGDNNARGQWINARRIVGVVTNVRYTEKSPLELHTPEGDKRARHAASDNLRADIKHRFMYWPGRVKSWLTRTHGNTASK